MTLNEFIKELQGIVNEHPEFAELPCIYSYSGHYNRVEYERIGYIGGPAQFDDVNAITLIAKGYLGMESFIPDVKINKKDINAIVIN